MLGDLHDDPVEWRGGQCGEGLGSGQVLRREVDREELCLRQPGELGQGGPHRGQLELHAQARLRRLGEPLVGSPLRRDGEARQRLLPQYHAGAQVDDGLGDDGDAALEGGLQALPHLPLDGLRPLQTLQLAGGELGEHPQEGHVALPEPVLRVRGQAAQGAVEPAVGQVDGHAGVRPHAELRRDRHRRRTEVAARVGEDVGQLALDHRRAVAAAGLARGAGGQREALGSGHVGEGLLVARQAGDERELHPEARLRRDEQVVECRLRGELRGDATQLQGGLDDVGVPGCGRHRTGRDEGLTGETAQGGDAVLVGLGERARVGRAGQVDRADNLALAQQRHPQEGGHRHVVGGEAHRRGVVLQALQSQRDGFDQHGLEHAQPLRWVRESADLSVGHAAVHEQADPRRVEGDGRAVVGRAHLLRQVGGALQDAVLVRRGDQGGHRVEEGGLRRDLRHVPPPP